MKEIKLTRGMVALVDDEDFERVNKFKWYAQKNSTGVFYAKANDRKNKTTVFLHRLILNAPKGSLIDHIDGNGCNNTKANLRICTKQQNAFNAKKMTGCYSRFKGVSVCGNRWRAFIKIGKKNIHLGCFATEEEAAIAYNDAIVKYHGDFARLNNITLSMPTGILSGLPS